MSGVEACLKARHQNLPGKWVPGTVLCDAGIEAKVDADVGPEVEIELDRDRDTSSYIEEMWREKELIELHRLH